MNYLGGLRGTGLVLRGDEAIAPAQYDFDGYLSSSGEITSSGEIRLATLALRDLFGRGDLHLVTPEGRRLGLRFSDKRLSREDGAAHVDVNGDLPAVTDWERQTEWVAVPKSGQRTYRTPMRDKRHSTARR